MPKASPSEAESIHIRSISMVPHSAAHSKVFELLRFEEINPAKKAEEYSARKQRGRING